MILLLGLCLFNMLLKWNLKYFSGDLMDATWLKLNLFT